LLLDGIAGYQGTVVGRSGDVGAVGRRSGDAVPLIIAGEGRGGVKPFAYKKISPRFLAMQTIWKIVFKH